MYISRDLAAALINADPSGLNEETLALYESFEGHVVILSDETEFRRCAVTKLHSDCVEVEVQ